MHMCALTQLRQGLEVAVKHAEVLDQGKETYPRCAVLAVAWHLAFPTVYQLVDCVRCSRTIRLQVIGLQ